MYEVEVKVKLRNRNDFLKNLEKLDAAYQSDLEHTDIYFNMPEGLRSFVKTDEALRLRKCIEYHSHKTLGERYITSKKYDLTYKGPKLDKETKSRTEVVCNIQDPDQMEIILTTLGFRKFLTIEKNRILYHIEFENCHIEITIDKIQHLDGSFSEFEIMVEKREDMGEARDLIFKFLHLLDYKKSDSIRLSYLELVVAELKRLGKLPQEG